MCRWRIWWFLLCSSAVSAKRLKKIGRMLWHVLSAVLEVGLRSFVTSVFRFLILPLTVGWGHYRMTSGVCLSVRRMSRPNSRTKKPRKPKIGRIKAHHTSSLWTYLEVTRSTVKVTRSQNVKALLLVAATRYVSTIKSVKIQNKFL